VRLVSLVSLVWLVRLVIVHYGRKEMDSAKDLRRRDLANFTMRSYHEV